MAASRSDLRENLMLALDTLRTHKFRSLLTILGVLIGTFIVIIVASIIAGLNAQMMEAINQFGARNMYIYKFEPGIHFRLTREERMRKPLAF
jgi:putative ABC transport system permease protein